MPQEHQPDHQPAANMSKFNYSFGQARGIADDVDETRTVSFAISSEQRDRYHTRLMIDRWELDNYKRNPLVGYNHPFMGWSTEVEMNPDFILGSGEVSIDHNSRLLIGTVKFLPEDVNPLAEKIFKHVKHGTLRSSSVGFFETKDGEYGKDTEARGKKNETYYYGGQELFEFSIVDLPANTDATVRFLANVRANCPTFVANELEKLKKHGQKGGQELLEATAEYLDIETELDLMKMQLSI